jgi:hypothetical protein
MAYDFWDTFKRFMKGAGTGPNPIWIKPTMDPAENIAAPQKIDALKNQAKPQQTPAVQNNSEVKAATQITAGGKTRGYASLQNPILKSIADMIFKHEQNTGNNLNQQGMTNNITYHSNPILKNIEDMVSNGRKQKPFALNHMIGNGALQNLNGSMKTNPQVQFLKNTSEIMQNSLNKYTSPKEIINEKEDDVYLKSSKPTDIKYESLNSNLNIPMMVEDRSLLINYIKEKNRNDAIEKVKELNAFSDSKFEPILNEIKNAKTVNFESSQKDITIDEKRNEALENNKRKGNIMLFKTIWDNIDLIREILSASPANPLSAVEMFIKGQMGDSVNNVMETVLDNTATKFTGYDKQGDKINKITRQSMNVEFSKDNIFGESYIGKSDISYEYHIVDNVRRILSITVNGNQIYNNYEN